MNAPATSNLTCLFNGCRHPRHGPLAFQIERKVSEDAKIAKEITKPTLSALCVLCVFAFFAPNSSVLMSSTTARPVSADDPSAATQPATAPIAQSAPNNSLHFTDVTASSGIDLVMTCGKLPAQQILEVNGGG